MNEQEERLWQALMELLPGVAAASLDEIIISALVLAAVPPVPGRAGRIVAGKGLWLRDVPQGQVLALMEPGIIVELGAERDGWVEVVLHGWCSGEWVERQRITRDGAGHDPT